MIIHRRIISNTATTLTIDYPWTVVPTSASNYSFGPVAAYPERKEGREEEQRKEKRERNEGRREKRGEKRTREVEGVDSLCGCRIRIDPLKKLDSLQEPLFKSGKGCVAVHVVHVHRRH